MSKTRFFCVAVEGATATDGRKIEASWLTDIAATYNRATYGARVNIEHIKGVAPESPFGAYGDVLAVKTDFKDIEVGGKMERRLALFAQIEPTASLVELTKKKQKIYTSIEVAPNFANSGKAGLVGLAATDNPASLGTDILEFSASNAAGAAGLKAMFDSRKTSPDNLFSAAFETSFELEGEGDADKDPLKVFASIGERILASLGGKTTPPPAPANEPAIPDLAAFSKALTEGFAEIGKAVNDNARLSAEAIATVKTDFASLKAQLENTELRTTTRPPVTGGGGQAIEC
ncbi:MAG: putative capsid-scaffolding protein [Phage 64_12]|nr:MAG: putative capsid-scaffolding protein [Phage 64_12]